MVGSIDGKIEITYKKLSDLKPHPRNPRVHPDIQISKLVKSMGEFGFTNPIITDLDNMILAGHARYMASKKKGLEEVPVITIPLTGDDALAYMVANNKIQESSEWDLELLKHNFDKLNVEGYELKHTGFDDASIYNILNEKEDEIRYELTVEGINIPLTEEEYLLLTSLLDEYLNISPTSTKFVEWLYTIKGRCMSNE